MFNPSSVVARTWYNAVKRGDRHEDDVPNLFNLREVVLAMLEEDNNA